MTRPTFQELDVIARARLHAERMGAALKPGQALYVSRDTIDTMNRWPHDTRGVGFTGRDDGWYWQGAAIRGST